MLEIVSLEFSGIDHYGYEGDCRISILIDGTKQGSIWNEEADLMLLAIVPPKDSKLKLISGYIDD